MSTSSEKKSQRRSRMVPWLMFALLGLVVLSPVVSIRTEFVWLNRMFAEIARVCHGAQTQLILVLLLSSLHLLFVWLSREALRRTPQWGLLLVFVIWANSKYWHGFPESAMSSSWLALLTAITIGQGMLTWPTWRSGESAHTTVLVLGMLVFFCAVISVAQFNTDNSYQYRGSHRWTGIMSTPNVFGIMMAIGVVCCCGLIIDSLNEKESAFALLIGIAIGCSMMLTGLFLSYSRGAWFGLLLAMCYLLYGKNCRTLQSRDATRRIGIAAAAMACAVFLVSFWLLRHVENPSVRRIFSVVNRNDFSVRNRVSGINTGLRMIAERPLSGYGWKPVVSIHQSIYKPAHVLYGSAVNQNSVVLLALHLGLPATALFTIFVSMMGIHQRTQKESPSGESDKRVLRLQSICRAAMIPIVIGYLVDGALFDLSITGVFFVLAGISSDSSE